MGFEPTKALRPHAFQACAIVHYATPPLTWVSGVGELYLLVFGCVEGVKVVLLYRDREILRLMPQNDGLSVSFYIRDAFGEMGCRGLQQTVPLEGIEPSSLVPETNILSVELQRLGVVIVSGLQWVVRAI